MSRWKRDVLYSVAIIVFCVVHWVIADGLTEHVISVAIAKPSAYSKLILGVLAVLAIVQLIRAFVKKPDEELVPIWTVLAGITMLSLLIYIAIVKFAGFLLSTFLVMGVLVTSYTFGTGAIDTSNKKTMCRQVIVCLLTALAITVITQIIFGTFLGAKLPPGKIF